MSPREAYLFRQFRSAIETEYPDEKSSFTQTHRAFREIFTFIDAHYAINKFASFQLNKGLDRPYIANYQIFQIQFNLDFLHTHVLHIDDLKLIMSYDLLYDIVNLFLSTLKFGYQFNQLCIIDYRYEQLIYENMIPLVCLPLICSNLPERFHENATDVEILKQRNSKLWRQLSTSTDASRKALRETIKYQHVYLEAYDLPYLHHYLHWLVEYLLEELPPFAEEQHQTDEMQFNCLPASKFCYEHDAECETIVAGKNQPLDVDHEGNVIHDFDAQGDPHGGQPRTLKVPIVNAASVNTHYFLPGMADFTQSCDRMEHYLTDFFKQNVYRAPTGKLCSSYASPSGTDIVKLASNIMTPWVKTVEVKPPTRVVMFDISGSMVPFLHLAVSVLEQFSDQVDAIYGFSTIISNIYRKSGFYEGHTTQGTTLKCIVEFMLKNYTGGELYIISDAQFGDQDWKDPDTIKQLYRFSTRFQTIILHIGDKTRLPEEEYFRCRLAPIPVGG